MFRVLVTGASRGIGLGVVRELAQFPEFTVIATCRSPSNATELQDLALQHGGRITVLPLDVSSPSSHEELLRTLASMGIATIDILFANAGVLSSRSGCFECTSEALKTDFETNVVGSVLTLQSYAQFVINSQLKLFAVTSSVLGSITNASSFGGVPSYRSSKAALNMFAVSFSVEPRIKDAGCKMLIVHPGWVKTDMGGEEAPVTVHQSSLGIVNLFKTAACVQKKEGTNVVLPPFRPLYEQLSSSTHAYVNYAGELYKW